MIYILLTVSIFFIFYAMIGYPITLYALDKILKCPMIKYDTSYEPTVTYMIVAHNEEKVIKSKLENAIGLEYPKNKFEILIASDNSTDKTNFIVEEFIREHGSYNIRLHISKAHKGKTNAQNEAQKTVRSDILIMTDANSILKKDAIRKLVGNFAQLDVAYVCGALHYISSNSLTSDSESSYWNMELKLRDIESRICNITAGNGAIYACRNSQYYDFNPMASHDSAMPAYYVSNGLKALFNPEAIAFEKAGATNSDEYKRKVRMNRDLLVSYKLSIKFLNVFKYGWFSLFYFGHRTCRYSLWFFHLIVFVTTVILAFKGSIIGQFLCVVHIVAAVLTLLQSRVSFKNKFLRMSGYYVMTVLAQYEAIAKSIGGKNKATWDHIGSTR